MPENPDLKQWRKKRALSQSRLAELLQMNVRTLQDWEGGRFNPPPFFWRALESLDLELGIATTNSEGEKKAKEKRNARNERPPR